MTDTEKAESKFPVKIYLKSGAVIDLVVSKLSAKRQGDTLTSLEWTLVPGSSVERILYISLDEVAAIVQGKELDEWYFEGEL